VLLPLIRRLRRVVVEVVKKGPSQLNDAVVIVGELDITLVRVRKMQKKIMNLMQLRRTKDL
jgi:predicted solute-binding protein